MKPHGLALHVGLLGVLPSPQEPAPYVPRIEAASPEAGQALAKFTVAPGHELALFAAEPELANPVALYVARDGAVYVAETFRHHQGVTDIRQHMDWLDDDLAARTVADRRAMFQKFEGENYDPGYGRAFDQVRRIVDHDGDFVADAASVFATGFADHAAGIGAGVLEHEGSVYYTCIPDLWKLRDADGDGRADDQTRLSSGYGVHVALLGHDLHGLRIGPDRRLYFSCGDRGFHVESAEATLAHPQCGAVLRCELDGSRLEVFHTGLRNPQELVFDDLGNLWTGDNNSDGGDRARWVNVVDGGDSGWRYAYQWITTPVARGPWNDEKLWHPWHENQAAYLVPPIANLGDGPAGLAFYPGTGLASAYAGHFFLCDFRGDASSSGIHTFTVKRKGAFYELGPVSWFLRGSLTTDCDFGPDGALWFSDWVYGWEQTGKGRVYRALDPLAQRSALVAETRALLARTAGASEDELLELLAHPDQRVRQTAHFALADARSKRVAGVALDDSAPLHARLHALWSLWIRLREGDGDLTGAVLALCERPDPEVRAQALRVLGDVGAAGAERAVLAGLAASEPRVRFFAALAAGRCRVGAAVAPLRQLLIDAGGTDPNLRHAAVMGLVGAAGEADLARLAGDPERAVRLGVILALRHAYAWREFLPAHLWPRRAEAAASADFAARSLPRFLLDEDPWLVLEAARAIHDLAIPGALESLAKARVEKAQLVVGERALVRRVLNANYLLARAETLASYAAREDLAVESRVEALEMLAQFESPAPRDRVTNEWRAIPARVEPGLAALAVGLGDALASAPGPVLEAWVRFAGASKALGSAERLAALATERGRSSAVKSAALEALETMAAPNRVATVRAALGDVDGKVRASALARLERLAPDEVLASLPELVVHGEIAERRVAYQIAGRQRGLALLGQELTRLEQDLVPAELALDLVQAVEASGDPALLSRLATRRTARTSDAALAPYLDALFGGDPARGQAVFERVDLSCTRCHAWWANAAERVGPNLFGVGERLTRLQLLESIVTPNRHTTPGFGARAFFLKDGRVLSGRVCEETDTLVRLFDAQNNPIALERSEIDEERADLSAMPEDLPKTIRAEEMRDLLAYLAGL